MQKLKTVLLVLSIGVLAFSSCKKSSSTNPSSSTSLSLKFNGTAQTASTVTTDFMKSENTLQVIAKIGQGGVSIIVQNPKVGTFDMTKDGVIMTYVVNPVTNSDYLGTTGSVTITSLTSTTISGTFQFNGATTSGTAGAITEGKFQSNIITQ